MKEKAVTGVYQLENGHWGYRFTLKMDGERISRRRTKDAKGQPFKTARQAEKARTADMEKVRMEFICPNENGKIRRRRLQTVYREYCVNGREGKAYTTKKRQDALWNNHILKKYGKRFLDDISPGEVQDYLNELYMKDGYSYGYVEGFLKQFHLIFGYGFARNYISANGYRKMCEYRSTKIKMPTRKTVKKRAVQIYSETDFVLFDQYFKDTNVETAYMIGKYTGVRVSECYGITWDRVDLEEGSIIIDRQFQTQMGIAKLVPPKTENSNRKIYLCDSVWEYLIQLKEKCYRYEHDYDKQRRQNEKMLDDETTGQTVSSLQLINTLPDGRMQTEHTIRHHSKHIKEQCGIDFKYHSLRRTYGTKLALFNTPEYILIDQMGHSRSSTMREYYLTMSPESVETLRINLAKL